MFEDNICIKIMIYIIIFIFLLVVIKIFFTTNEKFTDIKQNYIIKSIDNFNTYYSDIEQLVKNLRIINDGLINLFNLDTSKFNNEIKSSIENLKNINNTNTKKVFYENLQKLITNVNIQKDENYDSLKINLNQIIQAINIISESKNYKRGICTNLNRRNICSLVFAKEKKLSQIIMPFNNQPIINNQPNNNSNTKEIKEENKEENKLSLINVGGPFYFDQANVNENCDAKYDELISETNSVVEMMPFDIMEKYKDIKIKLDELLTNNIKNNTSKRLTDQGYIDIKKNYNENNDADILRIESYYSNLNSIFKNYMMSEDFDKASYEKDNKQCNKLPIIKF